MSIIITNITADPPTEHEDKYLLRINDKVICTFKHARTSDGLAQCLRDAADAVETERAHQRNLELIAISKLTC